MVTVHRELGVGRGQFHSGVNGLKGRASFLGLCVVHLIVIMKLQVGMYRCGGYNMFW